MKPFGARGLILGALLIPFGLASLLDAQTPAASPSHNPLGTKASAQGDSAGTLKMVLILSRHGVRSPTWTQARLNTYSAQPWPSWSVPPGYLTSRGFESMKRFGDFDRATLAAIGLVSAEGCKDAAETYIWADIDQRTLESGRALAEGMFPGCPPKVHSVATGQRDPLFHPAGMGVKPAQADAAFAQFEVKQKEQSDPQQGELLTEMNNVLLGCAPKIACAPARVPQIRLLGTALASVRGKGDHFVDLEGPLPQASSFAEDFLLEYADGMPDNQVGWGNVDENQVRRFLTLHSDYFDLMHRTPALARIQASNLLFHIECTLEQGMMHQPVADAVGTTDSKVVVLVGHDTNIAGVAALLGLHWTLDGRNDDTPPGTELAFELRQNEHGAWSVGVTVAMQTLRQLREMRDLTPAAPPARETLTVEGCGAGAQLCSWGDFRRIADAAIDKDDIFTAKPN
jgi:4-phytase / acid phosphatase